MGTLRQIIASGFLLCVLSTGGAVAAEITVQVNRISIDGIGTKIGTITLKDSNHGMIVTPALRDLPPGRHAFHIHENPNCGVGIKNGKKVAGMMAGGHFDPTGIIKGHGGHGQMHQMDPHGDLPDITADMHGNATTAVTSGKLAVAQVRGRSIMVHRYGSADPGKPAGGGPRYACGVIPH